MSRSKSSQAASAASNAGAASMPPKNATSRQRMAQDYLLVWVDGNIDATNEDCQNTLAQLRSVVNDVTLCTQSDECIRFLRGVGEEKVFVITSGALGQHLVPDIHGISKVDAIYIFCSDKTPHEQWTKTWLKIKGVHTNIKDICEALQMAVKQINQNSMAISFVSPGEGADGTNLNQLDPTFMYTQIFKEILLEMEHDKQAIKDLTKYCRSLYIDKKAQLNIINEFDHNYRPQKAIWWYTRECFTFKMLNRALRTLDGNIIINMGFFIHDLHKQIQALHKEQFGISRGKLFTVYRGQGLSNTDFKKLSKTEGGLLSFNNFLSTSKDRDVSFGFARDSLPNADMVGILFVMSIDTRVSSTPFADIRRASYFHEEEEILFSMHTVFRVGAIQQTANNSRLYEVELQLTADDDEELRVLTERIREEAVGDTGWERLGTLLLTIGQFDKAEELYQALLEQTTDESDKALYYHQLGYVKDSQGDHNMAIEYYNKALEIRETILPSTHSHLATSYTGIGAVYDHMGSYSKALSFYNKALEIFEQTVPSTHPSLATSYSNIGGVYDNMENYSKALLFYNKAQEIQEKTLPPTHPDLATSYSNICQVYNNIGEYSKALAFHKKAQEIQEKTLPPTHPDLATSYNNIGQVYNNMGEYSKALAFHKKAQEIQEKTLPPTHPDLATSYSNIGGTYYPMGEYLKALSFYNKALEIYQKTLPSTHPHLATSHSNIGGVYKNMREYSQALSFYEKALEIYQKTLPSTHPHLATSHSNIGVVYMNMGEYSTALSCYNKALEIRQATLPPTHPLLVTSINNIGSTYDSMGEYPKALSFYNKVLEIREKTLPLTHPDLATSYSNIGGVYDNMEEYSKALSFYNKALEIREKALPPTYRSLATSYNNIGGVYDSMGEYLKALSFYNKALEIQEKNLPPTHLSLATSCYNIGFVYKNKGEYSKALSYYERALDIRQRTLPADHPHLKSLKKDIEIVKQKLKVK